MRTFLYCLATGFCLFVCGSCMAQPTGALVWQGPPKKQVQVVQGKLFPDLSMPLRDSALPRPVFRLSAALVVQTQGWFCNRELQVQKATRLPLYFRLGNKEYADRMEGKQGYFAR